MTEFQTLAESSFGHSGFEDPTKGHEHYGAKRWQFASWWRWNNDYDVVIVFTGPEGVGKSTLSYEMACLNDPTFNARMRTGFGTSNVIDISQNLKQGRIVEMDEGVEGLLNRDAMRKENKEWQKWMVICRQKNLGVHICFPRFQSLDLYMREFRIWTWFQVVRRGFAWIRVRNWSVSPEADAPGFYESYPVVGAIRFPSVEEFSQTRDFVSLEDWQYKQQKKKEYIASFN